MLKSDTSIREIPLKKKDLKLLNTAFKKVNGHFVIYRQIYLEKEFLTHEMHFVFYAPEAQLQM